MGIRLATVCMLAAAGSVRYAALIVRFHQRRARNYLAAARPEAPAAQELHALLDLATLPAHHEGA